MATTALLLCVAYLAVAFGLRTWLQVRATGDARFRGISGRPGTPAWWAGVLFVPRSPVVAATGAPPAPPVLGAPPGRRDLGVVFVG